MGRGQLFEEILQTYTLQDWQETKNRKRRESQRYLEGLLLIEWYVAQ
jgi:hypothetical protein